MPDRSSTVRRSATGAAAADNMARTTKKSPPIDVFEALPDEEKKRQVAEFDQEFVAETFRPLTAARRRAWDRIKRKDAAGRGLQKARSISIPVDVKLLGRADDYAKAHGLTRAEVVELGLKALVTGSPRPKRRNGKA